MLDRSRLLSIAVIIGFSILTAASALADTNWQLVFRYDAGSLQLLKADPIREIAKAITTPGLKSAAVRVAYHCEWLDASGQAVFSSATEMPIGIRVPMGDSLPCHWYVPEEGVVVVRLSGPEPQAAPESLRLSRTGLVNKASASLILPAPFRAASWSFSTVSAMAAAAPNEGPVGVTKIRDTGPDDNRMVIVVMGDGYTAADLSTGSFETAAAALGTKIQAKSPWTLLFGATNLYRVDIESNESGADNETYGVYKDTYLNSSFWVSDIERLLALTGNGYYYAILAADNLVGAGVWDMILVLVNSTKYGGSGGGIAVSSVHSSSAEIVIHEVGHSMANLADEYEDPYPGYPAGDSEPNVDFDYSGPGLKWLAWVAGDTPLPTPESNPYLTTVGAFEGARYLTTGIYRPWYSCEMRALNNQFCPICKEAQIISFTQNLQLIDAATPVVGTPTEVDETGVTFTTAPIPFDGLEYVWMLNGVPIPDAYSSTLDLTSAMMTGPVQTLSVHVSLVTTMVLQTAIYRSYAWPVQAVVTSCCTGIVGDVNNDGNPEPTVGDIAALVDHLFITQAPLVCYKEADINQSGGTDPVSSDITIGDISLLVDNLFISGTPLGNCL